MLTLITPNGPVLVEAMLFDIDGTMVDSRPFHLDAWSRMARRLSLSGPEVDEVLKRTFGQTNEDLIPQLTDKELTPDEIEALSKEKEALYRELAKGNLRTIAGLRELLIRASQSDVRLAVASSGIEPNCRFVLKEFGLERYFAALVHGDMVRKGKPDPEAFLLAANQLGVDPSRCVVFEDAPQGLEAARRAGMTAVAIETHPKDELRDWAHMLAPDFHAVLGCLRG
jgi:beta-phosphoglucomutase family hydrolase